MKLLRNLLRSSAVPLCFLATVGQTWAKEYLSNLEDLWSGPTGTIGEINVLDYSYGPFVVQFFTGPGTNQTRRVAGNTNSATVQAFELTSLIFEFWGDASQPWSNLTIEVSQQASSNESIVVGELGNAVANPTPTQWPKLTTYIDFHPLTNIVLQPSTEYAVSLSVPYNYPGPPFLALLFTYSPLFFTPTDWRLGATSTHVPYTDGEYLKIAIGADAILSTNSISPPVSPVADVRLSVTRVGSKIVLSWPASATPSQLYAMPSVAPAVWTPVLLQPTLTNGNLIVTLPLSGSGCYFRLQAQ